MSFGVTPTGFVGRTWADILADLESEWRAIFGPDVDLSPNTPDAQILGVVAAALDTLWQELEAAYASFRPSQAQGAALSDLVQFNGLQRAPGSKTQVTVTLSTTGLVALNPTDRIESSNGDLFVPVLSSVWPNGSNVLFESVENAPITVPAGDAWTIVTPVSKLVSVSNAAPQSQVGSYVESDVDLRARRKRSTEAGAANISESLIAAVLAVSGVTRARLYENATNATLNGRPPHSYEVVAEGGTDDDVAAALWSKHPLGIQSFGSTPVVVNDSLGHPHTINITRPAPVDIVVNVVTSITPEYPGTGDDDIKQAILDYASGALVPGEGFGIGDDVSLSRLYTALNSVPGHNVTTFQIGAPALGTADVVIGETQVSRFTLANITVTS